MCSNFASNARFEYCASYLQKVFIFPSNYSLHSCRIFVKLFLIEYKILKKKTLEVKLRETLDIRKRF